MSKEGFDGKIKRLHFELENYERNKTILEKGKKITRAPRL